MSRGESGSRDRSARVWITVVVCVLSLSVLAVHAATYHPFMSDDAFISLRYSERLLDGRGLTWNDGERVEGYSNLLWVLAVALLGSVGLDLVTAARVLGLLGMAAAVLAVVWVHRPTTVVNALPGLAAAVSLAGCGCVAVWAVGGLEQGLVAGLLAWATALAYRAAEGRDDSQLAWLSPGILLALLCLTRPDGPIFSGTIAATVWLVGGRDRRGLRRGAVVLAPSVAAVLGQLAFRLYYYGETVPNTAFGKVALTPERLHSGLTYLGTGAASMAGLLVPAAVAALLALVGRAPRARLALAGAPLVAWAAYVVVIGGDIFPGHRHLVPVAVLASFMAAELWRVFVDSPRSGVRAAGWLTAVSSVALLVTAQLREPANHDAVTERWEWDGEAVGRFLGTVFGPSGAVIAVDPAGCVPYFSKLPAIDMLGLNDSHIAHNPPPSLGRGWIGHELGDGAYVLDRKPDLVLFCQPRGSLEPCFLSGLQMVRDRRFGEHYLPVEIEAEEPRVVRSRLWVRRTSPRVGMVESDGTVFVPGHLFAMPGIAVAALDDQGRIGVVLRPGARVRLGGVELRPGRFRTEIESSGGVALLTVREEGRSLERDESGAWLRDSGAEGGLTRLTLVLTAGGRLPVHVRGIVIRADARGTALDDGRVDEAG